MIDAYLTDTATLQWWPSLDSYGEPTGDLDSFGDPEQSALTVACRMEHVERLMRDAQGREVLSRGRMLINDPRFIEGPDVEMRFEITVVWQNTNYRIIGYDEKRTIGREQHRYLIVYLA